MSRCLQFDALVLVKPHYRTKLALEEFYFQEACVRNVLYAIVTNLWFRKFRDLQVYSGVVRPLSLD